MTFAATAEVVRYFDATPALVDCRRDTLCMDPDAAAACLDELRRAGKPVRAIIPMHYGGQMAEVDRFAALAREHSIALIEDAAHTLPAMWRADAGSPWRRAGTTADITCVSFYANKCITTGGEGGMLVTDDEKLAARARTMSLHGLSKDAWKRFTAEGDWYYEIAAPGFKYNLTDLAAAVGIHQLRRADALWQERRRVAERYAERLAGVPGVELPVELTDRQHSWHLYAIRVRRPAPERSDFIKQLKARGIASSVHWMPLHLHPYYRQTYGTGPGLHAVAEAAWPELISLPIFPGMRDDEHDAVCVAVREVAGGG
jgi:perosamine synthetase